MAEDYPLRPSAANVRCGKVEASHLPVVDDREVSIFLKAKDKNSLQGFVAGLGR